MRKYLHFFTALVLLTLSVEIFGFTSSAVVHAETYSELNSEVVVTDEGILIDGELYSQEVFEELLAQASYTESEYVLQDLSHSEIKFDLQDPSSLGMTTMAANPAELAGLAAGTFWIPGIGKVIVTIAGSVIVAGAVVKSGTWVYNKVKAYFAERSYAKAKSAGTKTKKHSSSTASSLPKTSTPLSSKDQIRNGKLQQRRYYGKNGVADVDIDYTNHGNAKLHPKVPHRHDWINGNRSTKWY